MSLRLKFKGRLGIMLGTAFFILTSINPSFSENIENPKLNYAGKYYKNIQHTVDLPTIEYKIHNRGNLQVCVANNGTFGTLGQTITDVITGQPALSCIYPKNSDLVYLWVGAFWIGAVVGRDTLVSTSNEDFYENLEFWPLPDSLGKLQYASIDRTYEPFYDENETAYSEEDVIAEYYDTVTNSVLISPDHFDLTFHKPLNIKVNQRSMAWSYSYAEDFILFDYQVTNIGFESLRNVYMGIYVDGDAFHVSRNDPSGWNDDMVGFYRTHPALGGCGFLDTVNIAWHADNDGDPTNGNWDNMSVRSVLGTKVVRTPAEELEYSFNWWITNYSDATDDFGPRKAPSPGDPFRSFGPRLGTPEGDKNKYYVLRHEEFDYDLLTLALDHTSEGYLPPPSNAMERAYGYDTRYLLSFGPFNIDPGETLPISFAWVAGADFHVGPDDFSVFDPKHPYAYLERLNFDDLAANARWAGWVYDNPGYDTDGDGYAGEFRVCPVDSVIGLIDTMFLDSMIVSIDTSWMYVSFDTTWYRGDNVPDFRGAGPPPSPFMKIIPSVSKLTVRWNGYYSENTRDVFSNLYDFEGYRIYLARDDNQQSFSILTSYDIEDYNRFRYAPSPGNTNDWVLEDVPFTLDSLQLLYGSNFEPLAYTTSRPFLWQGQTYYFEPAEANTSTIGGFGEIRKVYPEITVRPGTDPMQWNPEEITTEYGEPLPKYYEYEYVIDNLLSSVPYIVSVTTFDFGSPSAGLPPLESDPLNNKIMEYPNSSVDSVNANNLDVYVYPNPYLGKADYLGRGFEGLDDFGHRLSENELPANKLRRIHFANLPAKCIISIYSLDGDLISEIEHDEDPSSPGASHTTWDLISRNRQAVVSGLYYWVVVSETRTQMGKLVIIL